MAKISNPRKVFQFQIYIPGFNSFLCQDVKLPDYTIEQVTHGDTNYDVKTAGRVSVGELNISKLCPDVPLDKGFLTRMQLIQNTFSGGGAIPDIYKQLITIVQYANDGITPMQTWSWEGCWPTKINGIELSRTKSDNTIESIDFSVDRLVL